MKAAVETPITFPVPAILAEARSRQHLNAITPQEIQLVEDGLVRSLVSDQRQVGLLQITDGGFRRRLGHRSFYLGFKGVTSTQVTEGHIFQSQDSLEMVPAITGEIAYNPEHPIFNEYSFLQESAGGDKVVRLDLPAPALFLITILRHGWDENSPYGNDLRDMAADIARAYRATLQHLYEMGLRRVTLIDRSWGKLCDRDSYKRIILGGIDPAILMPLLREVNDMALEELPSDMVKILLVGAKLAKTLSTARQLNLLTLHELLRHRHVDAFMADIDLAEEFATDAVDWYPHDKGLILGVVDFRGPQMENLEEIVARVSSVAETLHPRWLAVSARPRMKPEEQSVDTAPLQHADIWRKINLLNHVSERMKAQSFEMASEDAF
ncbi:MAG: hypothetical protein LIP02_08990 [Bacteroidales bacterium]|nr:hypothetical protein [Bacteroidales bacterium]